MRRFLTLIVLALMALPAVAAALTVDEIAGEVEFRGYYVDSGVDIGINDLEELAEQYPDIGFVALDGDPEGGADLFADDVLASIDDPDTIVVLTASEAGVVTDGAYTDGEIDDALDQAFETSGDTYLTDFVQIAEGLTGVEAQGVETGNGLPWFWIFVVGAALLVWFMVWRGGRRREEAAAGALEAAREEIRQQMGVVANEIIEFSDRVDQSEHPEAVSHYRKASEVFQAAEARMDAATTPSELESLSDDLDVARWEMAAAEAIVEGREVPSKPERQKPAPCFFDPTHGAGVEEATLRTQAGDRTVMVCAQDADRLRRGERPEPRTIDVGGRRVPAPQAPRSSGGGGMDWLDAFSIIVGGMTRGPDYTWGRGPYPPRRSRSGLGGVLGGVLAGSAVRRSRGSGIPRPPRRSGSSRSRSASRTRSRSTSRRSRSTSRGRRSR